MQDANDFDETHKGDTRMKKGYTFCVLRYVHDPLVQEFVNVGVVLYAPESGFISALCAQKFSRIKKMFLDVQGPHFRKTIGYIESRIQEEGEKMMESLPLEKRPETVAEIMPRILPKDDSAFQFSSPGSGLTNDPEKTLENLYNLYVEKYEAKQDRTSRTESDVWRTFKTPLEAKRVIGHLTPHLVKARDFEFEFDYAWKNSVWHAYEPVSLDLAESSSIIDKANTWLGRAQSLKDAPEKFKMFLLIGKPSDQKLYKSYQQAENIMNKMELPHEFIREEDAESFAENLKKEIAEHQGK